MVAKISLERISHSKVESGVSTPFGAEYGPSFLIVSRIMGFHTKVKAQQEVSEVHAQTYAVSGSNFFVETIEMEHAAGLVGIVVDGPDIAGINEQGAFEHPEQLGPVLGRQDKRYVAALIDKVADIVARIV